MGLYGYSSASRSNNAGDGSINVTLNIQVKDVIDNETVTGFWLQDYNGRANSVIYIFQSTNSSLTNFLISENFFDSPTAQMPSDYKKLIDHDTRQISYLLATQSSRFTTVINSSTGNRIVSLNKNIQLQVLAKTTQVT